MIERVQGDTFEHVASRTNLGSINRSSDRLRYEKVSCKCFMKIIVWFLSRDASF